MPADWVYRQALTLTAHDALRHTDPLTDKAKAAILDLLRRLVMTREIDTTEEGERITRLMDAGCVLNPPYEATMVAQIHGASRETQAKEDR